MTNETIAFDTESEAQAWCDMIDARLGYPNPQTKTERYASPVIGNDGKFYVPTNPDCPATELNKVAAAKRIAPEDVKLDADTGKVAEIRGIKLTKAGK